MRQIPQSVLREDIFNIIIETVRENDQGNVPAAAIFGHLGESGSQRLFVEQGVKLGTGYYGIITLPDQAIAGGYPSRFPLPYHLFMPALFQEFGVKEPLENTIPDIMRGDGAVKIDKYPERPGFHHAPPMKTAAFRKREF